MIHLKMPGGEEDRSLLKRALGILRGRFGEEAGYGCYNLIEPMKRVRQDLAGEDFSALDLTYVSFNGARLGHSEPCGAQFRDARLDMKNLLAQGHSGWVESIAYAPDGKSFLSGSKDGTVRIWSAETGECLRVMPNEPGLIVHGCDMRGLHEGSSIDKELLRMYGALVD